MSLLAQLAREERVVLVRQPFELSVDQALLLSRGRNAHKIAEAEIVSIIYNINSAVWSGSVGHTAVGYTWILGSQCSRPLSVL